MNANDLSGFPDASFELITASQVMHWLDWNAALPGFARVLRQNAPLVLIESKIVISPENPLLRIFGLGNTSELAAQQKCRSHFASYRELLRRTPSIKPERFGESSLWIFREERVFDQHYASAYLFPDQIDQLVLGDDTPSEKLVRLFAKTPHDAMYGVSYWLVGTFNEVAATRCSPVR
jgi:hypothetical protein